MDNMSEAWIRLDLNLTPKTVITEVRAFWRFGFKSGQSQLSLKESSANWMRIIKNKKVLLRDRKRHTVRRVTNARSAVLFRGGYPSPDWGVPRSWDQKPGKERGTRVLPRKDLGPETWKKTWDWSTPLVWTDRHLWKQYLPHPSDARGKN